MIQKLLLLQFFLVQNILISFSQPMIQCLTKQHNTHVSLGFGWNGKSAGLADNYFLWENGKTIYIKFLNGSEGLKRETKKNIKELEQFTNLKFEFVKGESNIRIDFNNQKIIASALGTISNWYPQEESTLTIDTSFYKKKSFFRSLVIHTINHAIGIQDEIIDQSSLFNENSINDFFNTIKKKWPYCIDKQDYTRKYSFNFSNTLRHDQNSIMQIPLSEKFSSSKKIQKWNNNFSQKDVAILASLYPKSQKIYTDSTKPIIKFEDLVIKKSLPKKGFSIYPKLSFLVSNTCIVYEFLLFVYNDKGQTIQQFDDIYNLDGQLGDVFVSPPSIIKKQTVNLEKLDGIEFFIPHYYLTQNSSSKKISVVFKIYYNDFNYETQLLFESKPYQIQLL